jgi:hypothetical protein
MRPALFGAFGQMAPVRLHPRTAMRGRLTCQPYES